MANRLPLLLLVLLLGARTAEAGKPIAFTYKGCVTGGVFYSIERGGAGAVKLTGANKLDLAQLDGKFIEVSGWLSIGDYFSPNDKPPVVKRACNADDQLAIKYAHAGDLRMQAAHLPADKLDEAIALIEASIAYVQPANCDTYIDRAAYYVKKGDLAAAQSDVGILEKRACKFGGLLNWLLLQELAAELRKHDDTKTAVRALVLAKANCDAEICRPDIEKDLAAARAALKKK